MLEWISELSLCSAVLSGVWQNMDIIKIKDLLFLSGLESNMKQIQCYLYASFYIQKY